MNGDALGGLLPLEPPPPPATDPWLLVGLALLLTLAVLVGLWLRQHPRQRRLRRLAGLQRQLLHPQSDTRQLAGELEALLCAALGRQRLQADAPPPAVDAARWRQLLEHLLAARFSATGTGREQLLALLPDIRQLMGQARGAA